MASFSLWSVPIGSGWRSFEACGHGTLLCHDGQMSRRLLILGATGSIGRQAIEVARDADELEIVGLSAGSQANDLADLATEAGVATLGLNDSDAAESLRGNDHLTLFAGAGSAHQLIEATEPDIVLNAIVGFAGLQATVATLEAGCDLALANKESLVAGGDLVMRLAQANGASIIPVDSEHAAIAQLLDGEDPEAIESITLTASGGPFRGRKRSELENVTVDMALAHPTWSMGGKISIDSATLMNKGLELIEAQRLFDLDVDRINVVVHPQSIVHSLVTLIDSVELAHLGYPDMRVPIGWAISHPRRVSMSQPRLSLADVGSLEFEDPDRETFRCLRLAEQAARSGASAPVVLNAANEVAVASFLSGEIGFTAIDQVVEQTLGQVELGQIHDFDGVARADKDARAVALASVKVEAAR